MAPSCWLAAFRAFRAARFGVTCFCCFFLRFLLLFEYVDDRLRSVSATPAVSAGESQRARSVLRGTCGMRQHACSRLVGASAGNRRSASLLEKRHLDDLAAISHALKIQCFKVWQSRAESWIFEGSRCPLSIQSSALQSLSPVFQIETRTTDHASFNHTSIT